MRDIRPTTPNNHHDAGFTIVEVIVTLAITALFLTFFFQMYLATETQRINVARESIASDIAYSNLRKFTVRPNIPTCTSEMDLSSGNLATKDGVLLGDQTNTTDPGGTGASAGYGFLAEPLSITKPLGKASTQEVRAFAPQGCTNYTTNPLKLQSTVTYGSSGAKVVHAIYID